MSSKLSALFILLAVVFAAFSAQAQQQLSGNVFAYKSEPFVAVVVDKSTSILYIVEMKDDRPEIIAKTSVLVGGGGGDKKVSGDMKTPEGVYYITGFLSPEQLRKAYGSTADDYGTGAFPLSYPNFFDRISGKTGSGIWIHGKRVDRKEQTTRGCVALENDVLDKYKQYLKRGVPVVIARKVNFEQLHNYESEKAFLKEKLDGLVASWEGLDYDSFASNYHIQFRSGSGENYAQYLRKKKVLMGLYPERSIEISSVRAFKENGDEFLYDFNQLYCADNLLAYGNKKLYLKKEVDELKIIAEEFFSESYEPVVRARVAEFLEEWKISWESMDIGKYMAAYSSSFSSDGFSYESWKADKTDKFQKYSTIKINIDNIKISQVSPKRVRVSFIQHFIGDSYSDTGIKTLELEGCPGDYKIRSELWRAK
ncbi:L,D-transpeptidase family protein [Geovibrio thiophilus]|uniref:L,D-transpeptidase family protein n=1 Tax=Geovibrio thiophilus TaxID=139438 RepID=UPI0013E3463C|nr:L,D-transpeptidase family protein [Geovibrio thiophilus]